MRSTSEVNGAYLRDSDNLTYVIGTEAPTGIIAPYDLVTCNLGTAQCMTIIEDADEEPVLPSD